MATISLKLPYNLLDESGRTPVHSRCLGPAYIRRAGERMNRETRALLGARHLAEVSRKVRRESLKVNAEFAAIERA
jgi:hypothetical protein